MNRMSCIWHTASIELRSLSLAQTSTVLQGRPSGLNSYGKQVVKNTAATWDWMVSVAAVYPLDWQAVSEYNMSIGNGLFKGGGLRSGIVSISGSHYLPPIPTYADVFALMDRISAISDPARRAVALFLGLCRGQFFTDGNKRTALICANHILIHEKAGLMMIRQEDFKDFFSLLLSFYESEHSKGVSRWLLQNAIVKG